jgi:hypothetical protein
MDLFKLEDEQTKAKFSVVVFECCELLDVSRAVSALHNYIPNISNGICALIARGGTLLM